MAPRLACTPFTTRAAVFTADCACALNVEDHGDLVDELIDEASDMLYVLSGGRVTGRCVRDVRPVKRDSCGPWPFGDRQSWINWDSVDTIPLRGPNTEVLTVAVDGVVLAPSEYKLIDGFKLMRVTGSWPTSNDLAKEDTEVGTSSISYRFGWPITFIAERAAIELVCLMAKENSAALSRLRGVVSASVQGVNVSIDPDEAENLGLPEVSRFLDRFAPRGITVLGVYSPELDHGWRLITVTGGSGS